MEFFRNKWSIEDGVACPQRCQYHPDEWIYGQQGQQQQDDNAVIRASVKRGLPGAGVLRESQTSPLVASASNIRAPVHPDLEQDGEDAQCHNHRTQGRAIPKLRQAGIGKGDAIHVGAEDLGCVDRAAPRHHVDNVEELDAIQQVERDHQQDDRPQQWNRDMQELLAGIGAVDRRRFEQRGVEPLQPGIVDDDIEAELLPHGDDDDRPQDGLRARPASSAGATRGPHCASRLFRLPRLGSKISFHRAPVTTQEMMAGIKSIVRTDRSDHAPAHVEQDGYQQREHGQAQGQYAGQEQGHQECVNGRPCRRACVGSCRFRPIRQGRWRSTS